MECIKMSKKEIRYGEIIPQVIEGKVTQSRAGELLCLSTRQVKRLCKKYKEKGLPGLVHQARGKPSNHKIPSETKESVLHIIRTTYHDFSYQLIHEQLKEKHQITLSLEWIRQAMVTEGDREVKKVKEVRSHQLRARRSRRGELIQIDGSYHKWFEDRGPKCCLLVAIDDATSELLELKFVNHETVDGYMALTKEYIQKRGRPLAFYSDKLNVFKNPGSQFSRALEELDITLIHAHSPQAKGRVERANGTLQDRLIKLMRLDNIRTMDEANEYAKHYIADHNRRFARKPKSDQNAHRDLPKDVILERVLCKKESRKVTKSLSVHYKNRTYLLQANGLKNRLQNKEAQIYEILGKVHIEVDGKLYEHEIYEEQPYAEAMNRKEVDAWLDKKRPLTNIERHRKGIRANF